MTTAELQLYISLKDKKTRKETGLFIVEGVKLVTELVQSGYEVERVFASAKLMEKPDILAQIGYAHIELAGEKQMERISVFKNNADIKAIAHQRQHTPSLVVQGKVLVLDGIGDPGNLGTIIRIADWFGFQEIVCSMHTVDVYNPKVVSAAMGSVFKTRLSYVDLHTYFANLENKYQVYGAMLQGIALQEVKFDTNSIILIGSEANGISPELAPFVTEKLCISGFGQAESLNAAVATGIIAYSAQLV